MRIRNRKEPLPLSLLSPVPLSDPHLFSRSSVILSPTTPTPTHGDDDDVTTTPTAPPQPSDHMTLTSSSSSDLRLSTAVGNTTEKEAQALFCLGFEGGGERISKMSDDNNSSNQAAGITTTTTMGATTTTSPANNNDFNNGPLPVFSDQGGRWCDRDRVIPLKKRPLMENETMKKEKEKEKEKGVRTIQEGSRCSRVNGRGWRCCQPTLVGYSLCEHHLGKGRLRSITTVRGRPSTRKKAASTVGGGDTDTVEVKKTRKPEVMSVGKKGKLGVVKARSLSSLLAAAGQTNYTTTNNNNNNNNNDNGVMSIMTHEDGFVKVED